MGGGGGPKVIIVSVRVLYAGFSGFRFRVFRFSGFQVFGSSGFSDGMGLKGFRTGQRQDKDRTETGQRQDRNKTETGQKQNRDRTVTGQKQDRDNKK